MMAINHKDGNKARARNGITVIVFGSLLSMDELGIISKSTGLHCNLHCFALLPS